jgi:hypothetical protein
MSQQHPDPHLAYRILYEESQKYGWDENFQLMISLSYLTTLDKSIVPSSLSNAAGAFLRESRLSPLFLVMLLCEFFTYSDAVNCWKIYVGFARQQYAPVVLNKSN